MVIRWEQLKFNKEVITGSVRKGHVASDLWSHVSILLLIHHHLLLCFLLSEVNNDWTKTSLHLCGVGAGLI
jgi:hypothetical protein